MTPLLAGLAGALAVAGLVAVGVGLTRTTGTTSGNGLRRRLLGHASKRPAVGWWGRWRWPTATVAGMLAWLVSGWPVAGLIVTVAVVGLPVLLNGAKVSERAIARVQAIEEWTRRLADVLVVGVGLEQAITATLRTCPEPLRPDVAALVARLNARWPTETALRAFADDLDDASVDLVVAALVLASRRRGPGLARVLAAVADSVAEDVVARRKVEAERAKPRTTARAITLLTLGVVAVGSFNVAYLTPYSTPLGQAVLALIAAAFVGCLLWMRALTTTKPDPRFLTSATRGETPRVGVGSS